jgi:6-phosphogluconate dehydrogenase
MMLPADVVDPMLKVLIPLLEPNDAVIDRGNSYYHEDIRRAAELKTMGIHYLDVGTNGGVWGSERGYCLMIGGDGTVVRRLASLFAALAPGIEAKFRWSLDQFKAWTKNSLDSLDDAACPGHPSLWRTLDSANVTV